MGKGGIAEVTTTHHKANADAQRSTVLVKGEGRGPSKQYSWRVCHGESAKPGIGMSDGAGTVENTASAQARFGRRTKPVGKKDGPEIDMDRAGVSFQKVF